MNSQVDSIKNTVYNSDNIHDLQSVINFCQNPKNEDLMFVDFVPYSIPHTHALADDMIHFGQRNVLDYQLSVAILDRIEQLKVPNGVISQETIENFMTENKNYFMSICPKEFIGSPSCPYSVLKDFSQGKLSDIKTKDVIVNSYTDKNSQIISSTNTSEFQSFVSTQGPLTGKMLLNIYNGRTPIPNLHSVNRQELTNMFSQLFDVRTKAYHTVSMYESPARNQMPNNSFDLKSILKDVSIDTLKFIQANFDAITKNIIPTTKFFQNKEQKSTLELLTTFKKSIDIECKERDDKAQESIKEKVSPLSKFVKNNTPITPQPYSFVAGDTVLEGTEKPNISTPNYDGPSHNDI